MSTPLVVIGTSLGGLEALTIVLSALPPQLPAAVTVVQHRRPDSDSRLAHLLSRRCALPVSEAHDKDHIAPGRIYVAPADYHLLIDGHAFSLTTDAPVQSARPSIDVLFESAAEASPRALIGILLTAASEDGARGIEAIARAGGVTIVQDPREARSPIAPLAALRRATVQHVLTLADIGPQIVASLAAAHLAPTPPRSGITQASDAWRAKSSD